MTTVEYGVQRCYRNAEPTIACGFTLEGAHKQATTENDWAFWTAAVVRRECTEWETVE